MTFACDIDFIQKRVFNSSKFKELNEQQQQELATRVERFARDLNLFSIPAGDATQASVRAGVIESFTERQAFLLQVATNTSINPNAGKNLEYFLAYDLALEKTLLGMGDTLTAEGTVRNLIGRARRIGAGESHVVLANIDFLERSRIADTAITKIRRKYNIDRDLMDRIKLDMYEIGFAPFATAAVKANGPTALAFQAARQKRLADLMTTVGLDAAGQRQLSDIVGEVVASYNEVYEITKAFGISIGDSSEYINYLPRNFSPETKRRIIWKREGQTDYTTFAADGSTASESIYSMFSKSRATDHYIPEDAALIDFLITEAVPDIYQKLGVQSIYDVIQSDTTFAGAFVKYIDTANPALFDRMVEEGLISKLPMTTGEVYNYMTVRYELPFKSLSEFTSTDFETTARLYRNGLEQLTGRSMATTFVATAALEGGWGVTRAEKLADPALYRNYVSLVGGENPAIPANMASRFNLDEQVYSDTFVHPTVANFYRASIDIGSDPVKSGILARMWEDFNTVWVGQVLATSGFVFRQIYGVGVQTHAAGGNVLNYARNTTRMLTQLTTLWSKGKTLDNFSDMFDNVKARYYSVREGRDLTERELWQQLRGEGFTQDIMPWTGEVVGATGYKPSAGLIELTKKQARYMGSIFANGDLSAPQKFTNLYGQFSTEARRLSEKTFYSFQMMNVLLDQVARFSVIQSLTTDSVLERGTRALQGNVRLKRMSIEDAITQAGNYFYDYSDIGRTASKFRGAIPFFSYLSKNTFATARMIVRNPTKVAAYNRLYAAMNEPAREEEGDLPEAGVPGWLQRTNPVYWVDEATGQVIAFPVSSTDPVQDGQRVLFDAADDLLNLFGKGPQRSTDEELGDLPWSKTITNRTLVNLIDASLPPFEAAYGFVTGEDTRGYQLRGEGADDTSFLGVRMTAMNRFILSLAVPAFNNLNRSNPGFMFGRPPQFDPATGELTQAPTPAWITGAARDRRDYVADFRSFEQRLGAALGVNTYVVDVAYQMGKNETQVRFELGEGSKAIKQKQRQIQQLTDPVQIRNELRQLEEMRFIHAQLVLDWENFQAWRGERGLAHPAALSRVRREELTREQVRGLTEAEEYRLLEEIYGEDLP